MKKIKNNVGADVSRAYNYCNKIEDFDNNLSVRPTSKARHNKGITLIALVITIIVMLILVAVTITMAVNGGLFDYAGKATGDTQNAINDEQKLADGKINVDGNLYNSIDDYLAGKIAVLPYEETAKDENGLLTANATYTSGDYTAVIPKGFAIVPGLNGTTTIADGLVITDKVDSEGNSIGNEFVWIPVEITETDTETSIASFYRSNWTSNTERTSLMDSTTYLEPYADGYDGEEKEYYEMLKSVYENKGFYIGRFEAGSTTPRALYAADDETITEAKRTSPLVVKRDAYPYNYVGWGASMTDYTSDVIYTVNATEYNQGKGALYLSKSMYKGKNVGVTSTLCYGIMWDTMLDFINEEVDLTSSSSWGNYVDSTYTITRTTAKYYANNQWNDITAEGLRKEAFSNPYILLTTGASDDFATKNIFDVAGNTLERTNEADSSMDRECRGGHYRSPSFVSSVHARSWTSIPSHVEDSISFRCALYIK